MNRKAFGKAALSSLIVATTMVGCSGAAFRPSASTVKQKTDATKFATATEKALAARDGAAAIASAEAAVRIAPQNAAYRQLLGRAYVADGRFASAETALTDAMALGNDDARTVISLALVKVALGKNDDARRILTAHADTVPAADYGLALAMAGDPVEGVRVLSEAVSGSSANARTRQNLAYAYALGGRWKDARVMAGQDLDPLAANQRISQWAMMADPALAPQRVAALMGVTINASDAGQPTALALAPASSEVAPVEMAQAAPAPVADAALPAPVATVQTADGPPALVQPTPDAPVIQAEARPVRVAPVRIAAASKQGNGFIVEKAGAARKARSASVPAVATPVAKMQQVALLKPVDNGASNWVVQLGAFDTAAIAKDKWMAMARGNASLAAFPVLTSQATIKGKPFHRLAVSGFANRNDAMAMCRTIQAQRGQCFVREGAPGATPQRWAIATKGRQYASR